MYLLVALADVVQIHPSDFDKPSTRAIEDLINAKYADKVLHRQGLCVGLHSIISVSEGQIGHGSGMVNVNVDFRLIIYRPFKGEILHGTITHSNPTAGIYLSQDFFEDIVVPPETLFQGTEWERDDQGTETWIWRPKDEETGEAAAEFYFDRAEGCLFRVEEEQWRDTSAQSNNPGGQSITEDGINDGEVKKTPYLIRGSMMHSGLGPTLWWGVDTGEGADDDQANGT